MNVLVHALSNRPDIVAAILGGTAARLFGIEAPGSVPFSRISDALPGMREIREAVEDEELATALDASFLPTVSVFAWEQSVQRAAELPAVAASEWVTFIRGQGTHGVTAPDNDAPGETFSLFTKSQDQVIQRLIVDPAGPAGLSFSIGQFAFGSGHCTIPARGICDPGYCGGCRIRRTPRGLICKCDDE